MALVIAGFMFVLLIVGLAKLVGNGPLVTGFFLIGWFVFAFLTKKFFLRYDWRK